MTSQADRPASSPTGDGRGGPGTTPEPSLSLQNLFASVPVGLAVWDSDLRFVHVNDHLAVLDGVRAQAHLGRRPTEVLGGIGATVEDAIATVLRTGKPIIDAEMSRRSSGQPDEDRTWRVTYYPVSGLDGRAGVGAMITDVTDRARSEARLRASEKRFRLLVEGVTDYAILMLDADGRVASWNAGAARIHGYRAEDILGARFDRFFPDDAVRDGEPERLLTCARRDGRAESEGWRVRGDGIHFWAGAVITALREPDGGLRGYSKVVRDLTQQRAALDALRSSEATLRSVLQSAPDAILVVDAAGRIRDVNVQAERLFGYRAAELIGQPIEILVPDRLRDVHRRYRDAYVEAPQTRPMGRGLDLTARRKDGSEFPVEIGLGTTAATHDGDPLVTVVVTDITLRKQAQEQVAHQAAHDALTGLPNRSLFTDRLTQALRRTGRHHGQPHTVAVLFCDLDRFKRVNDSLGHEAGDALLVEVGRRLSELLRPTDTVARFGGDEFAVLCEGLDGERDAAAIAERILGSLSQPFAFSGRELVVTPSIGIALAAEPEAEPSVLLRDADMAMYRAKERGKARFELFDAQARAGALARLEFENDLRHAVEAGHIRVVYQPIFSLADGRIVAVEALARWDRDGATVPMDVFIGTAEETGLIVSLGTQVLNAACAAAAHWANDCVNGRPPKVSVNLSARQLTQPDLVDTVGSALRQAGIGVDRLCLELSESALVREPDGSIEAVRGLDELGVGLAIDGFGAGYSSLSRLRDFPAITLKIDRSFVRGMRTAAADTAVVAAVISLARAHGLTTVAVGVETAEQVHILQELGCHCAQGFHLGPPQSAASIQALLRRQPAFVGGG